MNVRGKDEEGANATKHTVRKSELHLNNIRRRATSAIKLTPRFAEILSQYCFEAVFELFQY